AYNCRLPYLFKVLALGRALSIQAHPNQDQARKGFQKENRQGLPPDAANRNYRDDNHKPELISALTPFWALNGFREIPDMLLCLKKVCSVALKHEIRELEQTSDGPGLKGFIARLLTMEIEAVRKVLAEALFRAEKLQSQNPIFEWMVRLHEMYPGDIGVLFPAILNLVRLEPGQAMYLPAGQFHAYLDGMGIELMANSDNVLRGGLTPKHVDVPALLDVLEFKEQPLEIIEPQLGQACEKVYHTPAREFELSVIEPSSGKPYVSAAERSAEILLVTSGKVVVSDDAAGGTTFTLSSGMSAVVPAAVESCRISGNGTVYKAAIPS
ncbi:MAG: mannose-6-phosphate isomerase, class I, partial [Deltaproteobacteria bacterium]|nr:mannose-6-phosphate isomerase, class I [Deltaproteobacteria bacterium]